jgi:hypothetical protein
VQLAYLLASRRAKHALAPAIQFGINQVLQESNSSMMSNDHDHTLLQVHVSQLLCRIFVDMCTGMHMPPRVQCLACYKLNTTFAVPVSCWLLYVRRSQ